MILVTYIIHVLSLDTTDGAGPRNQSFIHQQSYTGGPLLLIPNLIYSVYL